MEIRFGRPIVSSDGVRVGMVEGLVLDSTCRFVRKIRVLYGADERVVPVDAVTNVNEDGILDLDLTGFEVQQTSRLHGQGASGIEQGFVPYTSWVTGESMAPTYTPGVQQSSHYRPSEHVEEDEDEIVIDGEIVVTGPDGKVIGTIAGIEADERGLIDELIIDTGFLRPDIRVNMESVEYLEGSYVSHIL